MPKPWSVVVSLWLLLRWRRAAALFAGLAFGLGASPAAPPQGRMTLSSTDLQPGGPIGTAHVYDKDSCNGHNRSPQLQWSGMPAATRSFAVTMYDRDAPGPGWWHWAVTGIPPTVHALPPNASGSHYLARLNAIEARNDYGTTGYGGPCPPPGKPHRYVVTVYALGTTDLRLASGRPAAMFDHEIRTAVLDKASVTVVYRR